MKIKKLELLAPAKDVECGIAAINCGADALYIGAPKFGARAAVGNSLADIEYLIKYAHKYYAKVYAAVNTIIYDNEIDEVKSLINTLYNLGTDAIIIQDMGILEMEIPPIPIFASTQTHNYEPERIKFLEQSGIKRIILARELSIEQITEIKNITTAELEFFVHGALCVCLSGQCYFSQATTGRSANRGECSQPCRMLYSLEDSNGKTIEEEKYLLSLKDLNLSGHLFELIEAGITSFKIEGRLKDINYVKNITSFYRQKLDEIIEGKDYLKKASSGKVTYSFTPDPEKTFNRGYTEHFITGKGTNVASINTQKATGKPIGKVKKITDHFFEVENGEVISNGDGICFFDKDNILNGMSVNEAKGNKIFAPRPEGLFTGTIIYRNRDYLFVKELSKDVTKRKIRVNFNLSEKEGYMHLKADDEDNNSVEYKVESELVLAENPEKMIDNLKIQLAKSGDSVFYINEININLATIYFLSISVINKMRRSALELLENERLKNYPREIVVRVENETPYPAKNLDYSFNVANKLASKFYEAHGVDNIEPGFELLENTKGRVILTSKYCIKSELNMCPFEDDFIKVKGMKEPLFLNDGKRKYKLEFNCQQCLMKIIQ